MNLPVPSQENQFYCDHIQLLRRSYERLTGKGFGPSGLQDQAFAEATLKTLAERQATQARAQVAADYVRANLTWSRLAERLAWVWREVSGLG